MRGRAVLYLPGAISPTARFKLVELLATEAGAKAAAPAMKVDAMTDLEYIWMAFVVILLRLMCDVVVV